MRGLLRGRHIDPMAYAALGRIAGRNYCRVREIITALEPFKLSIKTLPSVQDLLAEKSIVSQMRTVDIADLAPYVGKEGVDHLLRVSRFVNGEEFCVIDAIALGKQLGLGARRLRVPGSGQLELRRHLPQQRAQERPRAGGTEHRCGGAHHIPLVDRVSRAVVRRPAGRSLPAGLVGLRRRDVYIQPCRRSLELGTHRTVNSSSLNTGAPSESVT